MLGNWQATDASLLEKMLRQWQQQINSPGSRLPRQSYSTQNSGPVWLEQQLQHDDQALVIYLPAKDRSAASMAKFMLANHLISPEYFHALRTEQQLGYLVGTGYVPMNQKPGMAFYVQSPKTAAADLYYATVIFYRKFLEELPEIPLSEFDQIKSSLIAQIRERDTSLASRAKRLWLAIGQGDYQCSLSQRIQDELAALTLSDFCDFCYTLLAPEYDAVFLATGPAPTHSLMRSKTAAELAGELELRTDWL